MSDERDDTFADEPKTYNGQLIESLMAIVDRALLPGSENRTLVKHALDSAWFDGRLQGSLDTIRDMRKK